MREKPIEPVSWLAAALNAQAKARASPSKLGKAGQATALNAAKWLEEQNAG
jgi:hypothetical protein